MNPLKNIKNYPITNMTLYYMSVQRVTLLYDNIKKFLQREYSKHFNTAQIRSFLRQNTKTLFKNEITNPEFEKLFQRYSPPALFFLVFITRFLSAPELWGRRGRGGLWNIFFVIPGTTPSPLLFKFPVIRTKLEQEHSFSEELPPLVMIKEPFALKNDQHLHSL